MPGVVEILTAAELGVAPHHGFATVHPDFARPPLADGRVRFVGEPIAVVLAETFEQGEDAAEMVWADIEPLPAYVDAEDALADGSEQIFPGHGSNEALVIVDKPRTDLDDGRGGRPGPLRQPARWPWSRWSPTAAPPRSTTTAASTFWASTQMPHGLHGQLAGRARDGARRRSGWSRRRSVAASAARPVSTPSTPSSPQRPADRSAGGVGAAAQRRHEGAPPQPRPDPVRRARLHDATATSPG